MEAAPASKRLRLDREESEVGVNGDEGEKMAAAAAAAKTRVVLAVCGSFSPITNMHLRMFG